MNTAACAAFSFGVHENRYRKPSYSEVKVNIPKKRSKHITNNVENNKKAPTVCENDGFQPAQYHLDLQVFKV